MENILLKKIESGNRITKEEALELFQWDILDLGKAADKRRKMIFPQEDVGFIIDRIINFTNICEAKCDFCAFHDDADRIKGYELCEEEIFQKIEELISGGGTQVMLQGGLHPDYTLETYVKLISSVRKKFPDIYIHSLSPAEIFHITRKSKISIEAAVLKLIEAGLNSIPGASDLLVDSIRNKVAPNKISVSQWHEVMTVLGKHKIQSSATMTYGMSETLKEKVDHLSVIREVQDETGIIKAFIPWSFSPAHTKLEGIEPSTGVDYLKIVAIGRIFLDNIVYIQAGWLTEGLQLAQIALGMGANDFGGVLTEEVVVKATGIETSTTREEIIKIIKNCGKIPVQRNSTYNEIRRF